MEKVWCVFYRYWANVGDFEKSSVLEIVCSTMETDKYQDKRCKKCGKPISYVDWLRIKGGYATILS